MGRRATTTRNLFAMQVWTTVKSVILGITICSSKNTLMIVVLLTVLCRTLGGTDSVSLATCSSGQLLIARRKAHWWKTTKVAIVCSGFVIICQEIFVSWQQPVHVHNRRILRPHFTFLNL